jgi:hypothetical protein
VDEIRIILDFPPAGQIVLLFRVNLFEIFSVIHLENPETRLKMVRRQRRIEI